MTESLVELYPSATGPDTVERLARCRRIAAEGQTGMGVPVRCARSISVPEEQTRVVFYQAASRQAASADRTTREPRSRVHRPSETTAGKASG
ncbi:MAG: hypothetical protein ACXVHJ_36635, partial [Solirubrobacteraceae bacterium]